MISSPAFTPLRRMPPACLALPLHYHWDTAFPSAPMSTFEPTLWQMILILPVATNHTSCGPMILLSTLLPPQDYPTVPTYPVIFVTFLDASKNDLHGKGAPRAVQGGVDGAPFDLVITIFEGLRRFPPVGDAPLLSGLPFSMTDRVVGDFLKSLADHVGLDRKRLVPHSPRVAAVMQLAHHSAETQCRQGNWMTMAGMLAYARGSLYHASLVSADLHDPTIVSLQYLRLMFMSPH
jgi:hypothetical protein